MADLAGGLIPEGVVASGTQDKRTSGLDAVGGSFFSTPDKHYTGGYNSFTQGGTTVWWYNLRVRDSGLGPPAVYRYWTSTDPDSAVPGASPIGSWVERTILDSWTAE